MGVGEKTAVKLLKEYGTLENALDHADEVKNKRAREGLQSGREKALLSQELVTIDTNMNIDSNFEEMATDGFDVNELEGLFHELEFQALINQIKSFKSEVPSQNEESEKDYKTLLDLIDIQKFANSIKEGEWLSFDLETTSLDPMSCDIVGFSFATKKNQAIYIPILYKEKEANLFDDHLNLVLNILRPVFENSKIPKTGQNIKFDALILRNHGLKVFGLKFDTLLAAHLINPDSRSLKLENLSFEHLNYRMLPIEDLIGKGRNQISMSEVELEKISFYASEDADIALQLTHIFDKKLKKQNLDKFFNEIEMPLLPVLLELEYNGMYVDSKMLSIMSDNLGNNIENLISNITKEAGTEFNINSTQQLANILFDIIGLPEIKKRSTAEEVLTRLKNEHPLPSLILEYRKLNKLKNTYIDALPTLINLKTKRIHSTFSQTVTSTGRLSSRNPNFQNIPIRTDLGREIRKAFKSENKDWIIFSADYSQIELRIMAHLSQDKTLLDAFNKGEDIHTRTAADVFNVDIDEVIPEMRRTAKIVNFGLLYGAGPFRMSQELGIPQKEAKSIIESYFERYSGIKDYIDSVIEYARANKYVKTILGRRRQVWDIDSNNHLHKEAAKRMAINMPIQGTNAEMIKIAMIDIQKELELKNMKSKMLLQIHDELVFEVPLEELNNLQNIVTNKMENSLPLSVPIVVDCGNGESWYEAH